MQNYPLARSPVWALDARMISKVMPQKQEPLTSISSPLERRRPRHPILKQAYGEYAELQQLVANCPKYLRTPESEEGTGFEIMGQAGMARVNEDGS